MSDNSSIGVGDANAAGAASIDNLRFITSTVGVAGIATTLNTQAVVLVGPDGSLINLEQLMATQTAILAVLERIEFQLQLRSS